MNKVTEEFPISPIQIKKKGTLILRQVWQESNGLTIEYAAKGKTIKTVGRFLIVSLDRKYKRRRLSTSHEYTKTRHGSDVVFKVYKSKKGYSVYAKSARKQEMRLLIRRFG